MEVPAQARRVRGPGSVPTLPYARLYPDMLMHVKQSETRGRLSRAQSQARTRAEILDAAALIFAERGFLGASVEAITETAGYSRGAFYSNFASKEELFAELLQDRVYTRYREMAAPRPGKGQAGSLRELGEQLAAIQADDSARWLFQLWLELL